MKRKNQLRSARPYRLHAGLIGKTYHGEIRYRYYASPIGAHQGALLEAKYSKPGEVITIWNQNAGRLLGAYIRHKSGIEFRGANDGRKVERRAAQEVPRDDEAKAERTAEAVIDSLVKHSR